MRSILVQQRPNFIPSRLAIQEAPLQRLKGAFYFQRDIHDQTLANFDTDYRHVRLVPGHASFVIHDDPSWSWDVAEVSVFRD